MYAIDNSDILTCQLYSAQQVKLGEVACAKQAGVSMYQLMELAGHAVFDTMLAHFNQANRIAVLAGRGNNGGDAYVFARLALQKKCDVTVFSFDPNKPLSGDAEIARQAYLNQGQSIVDIEVEAFQGFELIVDGLLGTGFSGVLRDKMRKVIDKVNKAEAPVIAIDLPSGLNADNGVVEQACVTADYTVTFVAPKVGLMIADGPDHTGHLIFAGLSIDALFYQAYEPIARVYGLPNQAVIPRRKRNTNKGRHGHVLCIGGDEGMPGAIYLAAKAGLRSGVGKASVICHQTNVATINTMCPELMVWGVTKGQDQELTQQLTQKLHNADVIVIGPGLGQSDWSRYVVEQALSIVAARPKPLVVDADGLNLIASHPELAELFGKVNCGSVLTPHPLEAARLLGIKATDVNQDRIGKGKILANKFNSHIVLKGNHSLVISGDKVSVNLTGNSGMASAGMGDVLTGIIAALVANKENLQFNLNETVKLAVYLHGLAGDFAAKSGEIGIIATDVIEQLPKAIQDCSH